jgi:predicted phosphohydrolase
MKFQIASDLHLDQIKEINNESLIKPCGDILILAGDICHAYTMEKHIDFFKYISEKFRYVLYIPGNHEFYLPNDLLIDRSINETEKYMLKFFSFYDNIIYLNNKTFSIDNINIIGSCLWEKIEKINPWFKVNTTIDEICELNQKSIKYITEIINPGEKEGEINKPRKNIIITHYPFTDIPTNTNIYISGHTHKNFVRRVNVAGKALLHISNQRKGVGYSNGMCFKLK